MNKKRPLTLKQYLLFTYVKSYKKKYGIIPTVQEMADHFSRSRTTIHEHIGKLVSKGYLRRYKNLSRGLEILGD